MNKDDNEIKHADGGPVFMNGPVTPKDDISNGLEEHLLKQGSGTRAVCSCGKYFGTYDEASQHQQWQLSLAQKQIINNTINKLIDELPKLDTYCSPTGQMYVDLKQVKEVLKKELSDEDN